MSNYAQQTLLEQIVNPPLNYCHHFTCSSSPLVRFPEPWNYSLSFNIYVKNLSKLLRAQEFQGSGVVTPLEWLLEKLKAFSQLLVILGSYFLEN